MGYSLHKGTETLVRDRERFEIESTVFRQKSSKKSMHTRLCYENFKTKIFPDILCPIQYNPMQYIFPCNSVFYVKSNNTLLNKVGYTTKG